MLANFPYHNEGEHIERQFRIWYAVALGVFFGVVSLLLTLLINPHSSKLGWKIYTFPSPFLFSGQPGLLSTDEFDAFNILNIVGLLMPAPSVNFGVILTTQDIASLGDERTKRLILANTRTKRWVRGLS